MQMDHSEWTSFSKLFVWLNNNFVDWLLQFGGVVYIWSLLRCGVCCSLFIKIVCSNTRNCFQDVANCWEDGVKVVRDDTEDDHDERGDVSDRIIGEKLGTTKQIILISRKPDCHTLFYWQWWKILFFTLLKLLLHMWYLNNNEENKSTFNICFQHLFYTYFNIRVCISLSK